MKKNYYYTPEVKFHQLKVRTSMLQSTAQEEVGNGGEGTENDLSKGFGSFYFDEDED